MPTLEKLYRLEPESLPFRQAVDPILLQIPVTKHYVHIIVVDMHTPVCSSAFNLIQDMKD